MADTINELGLRLEKEIARCQKQIEQAKINIAQNEAVMDILRDYEFTLKEMYKLYRAEKEEQED